MNAEADEQRLAAELKKAAGEFNRLIKDATRNGLRVDATLRADGEPAIGRYPVVHIELTKRL
jgi:hypothetical protein